MPGTRTSTVSLLLLWLTVACFAGANPDYFPLQVGNTWVYRTSGAVTSVETMEIVRWGWIENRIYYFLRNASGDGQWVRMDDSGTLWVWDDAGKTDKILAAFNGPVGDVYPRAERMAADTPAGGRVRFHGWLDGEPLKKLYL